MVPSVVLLSAIDWAPLPVPVLELRKDSRKAYPSCRAEASGACLSTRGEGSCLLCTVIGYCATEIYGCVFAGLTVSDILDTGTQIDWNLICIISTVSKTLYIPKTRRLSPPTHTLRLQLSAIQTFRAQQAFRHIQGSLESL